MLLQYYVGKSETYFGLLLPQLFDECQVFIVFGSLFTQTPHHLRGLGYTGLDGFISALMGFQ